MSMYHSPAAGRDSNKAFSAFVGQVCVLAIGEVGVVGAVGVIIGSSSKSFISFLGRLEFFYWQISEFSN